MKVNSEIVSKEKYNLEGNEIEVLVLETETKSGSNEISIKRLLSNKYGVIHEETVIRNGDKKQKIVSKLQDYTIN